MGVAGSMGAGVVLDVYSLNAYCSLDRWVFWLRQYEAHNAQVFLFDTAAVDSRTKTHVLAMCATVYRRNSIGMCLASRARL